MLTHLAHRYGTPLYVYRRDRVRRAALDLRAALPAGSRLYYSLKANPHPDIVAELAGRGLHTEVSSDGELASAVSVGQPGTRCLYTGPGKTWDEIVAAIRQGVRLFSVESPADHRRLARAAEVCHADVEYLVRLNGAAAAGSGLRMTGRASQFGVDVESAELGPLLRTAGRARPVGVHIFSATNVVDEDALIAELDLSAAAAADVIAAADEPARLVDLGGGFAAPFARPGARSAYPRLKGALEDILDRRLPGWRAGEPQVAFESGRYLVADSGTLLTTILDVKHSRGTTYVVLDAGINALGGIWGLGRLLTPSAQPAPLGSTPATLVGPLCTPLDVLARTAQLSDPRPGAVVAIPNVGAYGLTASLVGFLSRSIPTEVVLDADDDVVSVRRLELRAMSDDREEHSVLS